MVNNDREFIPNQRITTGSLILEVPADELEPGFYDLMADGDKITTLAFNFDHRESDLRQLTISELEESFAGRSNVTIFQVEDERGFENSIREQFEGVHLWKLAILFGLIFLLAEIALVRLL